MTTNYLFDTSVLVESLKQNVAVQQRLATSTGKLYTSVINLGELLFGAKSSSSPTQSIAETQRLIATLIVLRVDEKTAEIFGDIKSDLRAKGQMIPDNDIWIAAAAQQFGLTLASRDAHFTRVAGLLLEQW